MIKICIDKLVKGQEVEKFTAILINMAKEMDKNNL